MPPENTRARDLDDDDALDIRKRDAGNGKVLMWVAIAAIGIVLTACLTGGVILIVMSASSNATAAKLPGSWKGQFVFGGQAIDAIYVFEKGGEFRQETLNPQGQVIDVSKGRWHVALGEIVIDWDNGSFEHATVIWTNDQTMEWQIVDHSDEIQIGSITTLRRQAGLPKRR